LAEAVSLFAAAVVGVAPTEKVEEDPNKPPPCMLLSLPCPDVPPRKLPPLLELPPKKLLPVALVLLELPPKRVLPVALVLLAVLLLLRSPKRLLLEVPPKRLPPMLPKPPNKLPLVPAVAIGALLPLEVPPKMALPVPELPEKRLLLVLGLAPNRLLPVPEKRLLLVPGLAPNRLLAVPEEFPRLPPIPVFVPNKLPEPVL